jgi:hypothetical protein
VKYLTIALVDGIAKSRSRLQFKKWNQLKLKAVAIHDRDSPELTDLPTFTVPRSAAGKQEVGRHSCGCSRLCGVERRDMTPRPRSCSESVHDANCTFLQALDYEIR